MPGQRYDSSRITLGGLLSTTSPPIEVPEWQRSYSWEPAHVEAFWQDLVSFSERFPDELIEREEYFLGSIVLVTGGNATLILDGQQRLVTATILLSALRDARATFKGDAATRLQHKYIADFDDATGATTYVLTLNVYDREFFMRNIQDETSAAMTAKLRSHGLIKKARQYFDRQIAEMSTSLGGGEAAFRWNLRITKVLVDHMSVIAVTSGDEDSAAEVFETLNDRGLGLSTPDLLRTLLLRRAADDTARERIVNAWQHILATSEEASVDDFLRHYWISERGDVKSRKLYREMKKAITAENIEALAMSLSLADAASIYRDLVRARSADPDFQRQLQNIRELGAKATYPVLLAAQAAASGDADAPQKMQALAAALLTMFVRYNIIGGRETTVMEATLYQAAARLRATGNFDEATAAVYALAPDAATFIRQFRVRSVSRVATARYILREIEHRRRVTQEVAVEGPDRVHLEHIYPQTPAGVAWPNHSTIVNRLGNLTLLGKRLNMSIQNSDFNTKKSAAYSTSDILMTKDLCEYDDWTPDSVEMRQRDLSMAIVSIWPIPGESAPDSDAIDAVDVVSVEIDVDVADLPEVPTG